MGAHNHGVFSFTVRIERMRLIGGDEFVAEVTSLRRHDVNGSGKPLDVPNLPEQYGATASEAESHAVHQMRVWLSMAIPFITDHADRRLA